MDILPSTADAVLLGASPAMRAVRDQLAALAALPWHVRIEGPTGSGKGLAARVLHRLSPRRDAAFISCHINALADGLEVAELLGYARGAFTGAIADRPGLFEAAHAGTLFVDEISTASPRTQLVLLQLVDEGTVQRLGERRVRKVDVRAVFATNADLEDAVREGRFREDLFHRLGVLVVHMPALRAHRADIPDLAACVLTRKAAQAGVEPRGFSEAELACLRQFDWPGNVRQLEHVLEHFVAFGCLPALVHHRGPQEWQVRFDEVVKRHGDNRAAAARALGISRTTLYKELRRREA